MGKAQSAAATAELVELVAEPLRLSTLESADGPRPDFKVLSGRMELLKKEASSDGKRRIRCIASSSMKDLHGDTMTEHCIRSMAKQAPGLTIFLNHKYGIPEDVFGYVEKARTKRYDAAKAKEAGVSEDVILKATAAGADVLLLELTVVLDEGSSRADRVYSQMENGITLGVSIGALITDYEEDPEYQGEWWPPLIINDVDLLEASVVGIPANPLSWVEGAAKALIAKGAIKDVDDDTFNKFRRYALLKERAAVKEADVTVQAKNDEATQAEEPEVAAEPAPEQAEEPEEKKEAPQPENADGLTGIIAHFQFAVEAGLASRTDLDAMEDAVQRAIDNAVAQGVDKAEFEGQTAKDIAMQILNSEPALDTPETAGEGTPSAEASAENPDAGQEAPASDPAPGTDEAAQQAAAEVEAIASAGILNSVAETMSLLQRTLEEAIATKAENERLRELNAELVKKLEDATETIRGATEFVDKVMELPIGRKSVVQREAAGFAERLKGSPYSAELLAYIAKNATTAGASNGS